MRRKARRSKAPARSRSSCSRTSKGIEGVADIEPSVGVPGEPAARPRTSISCVRRCRSESARTRRRKIITEMRRRLAAHPGYRPEHQLAQGARQRRGTGGFAIVGEHPGTRSRPDRRVFEEGARGGAEYPEPDRGQDRRSTSRTRRYTSPSTASAPPISACGWRRSATRCGWPSPATIRSPSTRKGRSSTRSRSACSRASAATSRRSAG